MESTIAKTGRVTELDGLRGVLAWTVVAAHLLLVSGWYDPLVRRFPLIGQIPDAAVDIFMLLSGFAITHLLMMRPKVSRFYFRRACRIVPAYWVALAAGILLNGTLADNLRRLPPATIGPGYLQICEIGANRLWLDGPIHFLFLQGLVPAAVLPFVPYTLLGVAWSLSLEFQFYLATPLLFTLCRRFRVALIALIVAIGVATLCAGKITAAFSIAFLPVKAGFFFVGSLSYFALDRGRAGKKAWLLCIFPSVALAFLWSLGSGRTFEGILAALVWVGVTFAIRYDCFTILRSLLNSRALQFLGRVSYSTYLFHAPIIFLLQAALWRSIAPRSTTSLLLWTTLISIPAIVLISWISWRFLELPFQRIGRRDRKAHRLRDPLSV